MSNKLISDSFTNRTKILNLRDYSSDILIDNLNISKFYIGNFNIYKINSMENLIYKLVKMNN